MSKLKVKFSEEVVYEDMMADCFDEEALSPVLVYNSEGVLLTDVNNPFGSDKSTDYLNFSVKLEGLCTSRNKRRA